MPLSNKDIGRIRWLVLHHKLGTDSYLQQAVYIIESDSVEWRNIEKVNKYDYDEHF